MYYKKEPIAMRLKRVAGGIILIAASLYGVKHINRTYDLNFWEKFGFDLATSALIMLALYGIYTTIFLGRKIKSHHIRGTKLISYWRAESKAIKLAKKSKRILWGLLYLPVSIGTTHFAVIGATGSGKTVTLRLLMQTVLPLIGRGHNKRAIVYDPKQDALPILSGICEETKIVTLNPFDERCYAWDMAKDVTSPASCQQLVQALVPDDKVDASPYFINTAKHILSGILLVFNKRAKGEWTLRDLMVAIRDSNYVKDILGSCKEAKVILNHFEDEKAIKSVLSTLITRMQEYEFIAAAWDKAQGKVSLRDWLLDEYILVLGSSETAKNATDTINRVIFRRMTELLLSQSETETRQTWIFLDEARQAGKLDALNLLLTKGRSKGACCVLGFQDIEGMREVYGSQLTNELVGQCNNKAILKLNSPETAEWASKLFGDYETVERRSSSNQDRDVFWKGSTSVSEQRVRRKLVMPGQFLNLPATNKKIGFEGFYITPEIGSFHQRAHGKFIAENLVDQDPKVEGFIARPESHQSIRLWNKADLKRLGLQKIITLKTKDNKAKNKQSAQSSKFEIEHRIGGAR